MRAAGLTVLILSVALASAAAEDTSVTELRLAAGPGAEVILDPDTGVVHSLRLDRPVAAKAGDTGGIPEILRRHPRAFGLTDATRELELVNERVDRFGQIHRTYRQTVAGIPVLGARLRTHLERDGRLRAVTAKVAPFAGLVATRPKISADRAAMVARAGAGWPRQAPLAVDSRIVGLAVVRTGLLRGRADGRDRLTWEVEILHHGIPTERLFVDAHRATLVERVPLTHDIHRVVHHRSYPNPVWSEDDPRPVSGFGETTDGEIETLIDTAGEIHTLFENLSGGAWQSWDGDGAIMHMAVDYQGEDLNCPNAQWLGGARYTRFCAGTANDDVTAHEWAHAYTNATHGLIYQWQSGALNESYSDIWGEVVDQLNGTGFDEPGEVRSDGACSAFGGGAPALTVLGPGEVAGGLGTAGANFNPVPPWNVTAPVELVDDGVGNPRDACDELEGFTPGRIALIEFDRCLFYDPVARAESAGAAAAIVVNTVNDGLIEMTGFGEPLGIPAVLVGRSDGHRLIEAAADGDLEAQLVSAEGSTRWLIAEDTIFETLRDMWLPSCQGHPTAVRDALYHCDSSVDNGGVHINSGVPNRAFALLVDGGEAGGVTVPAIGLTKAAHLYWRAMSVYQVPITDFADHADALAASCADLVGVPLADLSTGEVTNEVLTAADCSALEAAATAVGLRDEVPCSFQPLLEPETPPLARPLTLLDEPFTAGIPDAWDLSDEGVFDEYDPRSWQVAATPPDGSGDGAVVWAASDPTVGDCAPGSDDQSGVVRLVTPSVTLAEDVIRPTAVVDHYVATIPFPGGDGGNLKISVNGGPFDLVPRSAFLHNPYSDRMASRADGSTNPLAGEEAFVGFNEGFFEGSWGQSQVDLSPFAGPGDTLRLRFDFGTDGCLGLDGWYLDRVQVVAATAVRAGSERRTP